MTVMVELRNGVSSKPGFEMATGLEKDKAAVEDMVC